MSGDLTGFWLLDKPAGISSNDLLQQFKRAKQIKKMGHTGTLDPFATGLIVAAVGEATKFIPFLDDEPKCYQATLRLGIATDTLDLTGKSILEKPVPALTRAEVEAVLAGFLGEQDQTPPMYSAKKIMGTKLYEMARQGLEVDRKAASIMISSMKLLNFQPHELEFEAEVSKGTYIRVLGEDIAKRLQTVGHLTALRRLQTGRFVLPVGARHAVPLSITEALAHLQKKELSETESKKIIHGQPVSGQPDSGQPVLDLCRPREGGDPGFSGSSGSPPSRGRQHERVFKGELATLFYKNDFLGVAEIRENQLWPKRLISSQ